MTFDLPTLGFILGLTHLTQVAAFLVQCVVHRGSRGVGWWLSGSACNALGFLFLVSDAVSGGTILGPLGNPTLVVGRVLILIGVLRFLGQREKRGVILALYGVFLGTYYVHLFIRDSIVVRTITVSAAVAACSIAIAHHLFRAGRRRPRAAALRFTGAVFLIHGVFLLLVCAYTGLSKPISSYAQYAPIQVAIFIVPALTSNLWTFGLILVVNQRLSLENLEEKEKLQRVFNIGPDAAQITRLEDGRLADVNLGFLALTGHAREEVLGRSTDALGLWRHPEERAAFLEELREKGVCEDRECLFQRRDGQTFPGLISGRTLPIDGVPHAVSVIRDMTVRKREEAERLALEARNRQLQKAESLGRMAGAIAHLFNNHLQSVLLNLDLLNPAPEDGSSSRVDRARKATERAGEVSRLMLAYLGQGFGEQQPQDLAEVCRGCLPALQGTSGLEWELPFPGPRVLAHAPELQQVLSNLVRNAEEAMAGRQGGIRVRLGVKRQEELPVDRRVPLDWTPSAPAYACLEVEDDGHGIEAPDMDRLFDPFFSTRFTGRGLGLPVALGIVHAHGGAMAVHSRPGEGSVFTVLLPLQAEAGLPGPEACGVAPRRLGKGTVLLVDDDPSVLEATGALIERMGYGLLTAVDGVEALEVYRRHQEAVQCVITDLTMPRKDGWELLAALRRIRPELPVVLASGYAQSQVLGARHVERPQAFLGKPYGRQQLQDALARALG